MKPHSDQQSYALLDSGNLQKLEQIGPYTLIRPSPQAIWSPTLPKSEWKKADGVYTRGKSDDDSSGKWEWKRQVKREFDVLYAGLYFHLKLTNFGHMGLFPEQNENWEWLRDKIRVRMEQTNQSNFHVLNLFAYTGGSSLAASQAGAHVAHVDAAKGVVDWARKNAELSHLNRRPIRWLVDDALKFVRREERRGNRYHGIIFDPPSFGRGPKGEVFKIEKDLRTLLDACRAILAHDAQFVLYSCHTPGFTPLGLSNQLQTLIGDRSGTVECGEMVVPDASGRPLPSGVYARWCGEAEEAEKDEAQKEEG